MLTEGTTHRTGDQISNDLQLLGTGIGAGVGSESGRIGFTSTADKFEKALAVTADVLENPSFPQEALDRLKGRLNVQLLQNRDRTDGHRRRRVPESAVHDEPSVRRIAHAGDARVDHA